MAPLTAAQKRKRREEVDRAARDLAMERRAREALPVIDEYLRRVDPADVGLLTLKANILDTLARFDEAVRVYRRALRIDPSNARVLLDMADTYACCKRQYGAALQYYDRALERIERAGWLLGEQDAYVGACIGKADALLNMRRPLDAMRCLVAGLVKFPADMALSRALRIVQVHHLAAARRRRRGRGKPASGRPAAAAARGKGVR